MITPPRDDHMVEKLQLPELTIVVPTRNESQNIQKLIRTVRMALIGISCEILIIDDSDDDTFEIVQEEMQTTFTTKWKLGAIHRETPQERQGGLATAVVLGLERARSRYVAVIDADLQHPPEYLRKLYEAAIATNADIVVATRYRAGGSYEGLDGFSRRFISIGLKTFAKSVFPDQIRQISDPLGGFFLIRRDILDHVQLRPIGYKISLEIMIRTGWTNLTEVPYAFRAREGGQSKSNMKQGLMVLWHIGRLLLEVPAAGFFWKYLLASLVSLGVLGGMLHTSLGQSLQDPFASALLLVIPAFIDTICCTLLFGRRQENRESTRNRILLPLSHGMILSLISIVIFFILDMSSSLPNQTSVIMSFLVALILYYLPTGNWHFKMLRRHVVRYMREVPTMSRQMARQRV